jgi:hypothetical protein
MLKRYLTIFKYFKHKPLKKGIYETNTKFLVLGYNVIYYRVH